MLFRIGFTIDQDREALEASLNVTSSDQMASEISFVIWSAVVSTTRGFGKVAINIDPRTHRVFVKIGLRWWSKSKKLEPLRKYWLVKAERKAEKFIPTGWNSLFYYDRETLK